MGRSEVNEILVKSVSMWQSILTFLAFTFFVFSIPVILISYSFISIIRSIWLRRLTNRNPHLELVKGTSARTAMDTYRYQGVVTVLLKVKGSYDQTLVKKYIQENIIEKRTKDGKLRFPHMKMKLTSCWGRYAWVKDTSNFNLDNHVIYLKNPIFRSRPVTSATIQDYVSNCISKFIPPWNNAPPWQLLFITTEVEQFYILARLHHLQISEDRIGFGDLLMINPEDQLTNLTKMEDIDCIENVLASIFDKPVAIPMIYNRLRQFISNKYQDLISIVNEQDRSKNNNNFNLLQFLLAIVIIFSKSWGKNVKNDFKKYNINFDLFLNCLINTFHPIVLIKSINNLIVILITKLIEFFIFVIYFRKYLFFNLKLINELIYIFRLIYHCPKVLIDEIIVPMFTIPKHYLQKVSMSGRKVVSWTEPIPIDVINKIREKTHVASCEIHLYGVAAALQTYFLAIGREIPKTILTTTRFIPQENLLKSANKISSGLLCLPLPLTCPLDDPLFGLHLIQVALQDALTTQTALYLASLWQYDYGILTAFFPSFVIRLALYILSTRYSVMLTQVEAHTKEMQKRHLIWGQEVESFLYWRPPQANIRLSISLISYCDEFRFAVMADAELAPAYTLLVDAYVSSIKELESEAPGARKNGKKTHSHLLDKMKQRVASGGP